MVKHWGIRHGWSRGRASRRVLAAAMALLLGVPLLRLSALQGLLRPIRVTGGSMAEALTGEHYRVGCDDCGGAFACGVEYAPADGLVVCPNCGYAENTLEGLPVWPGQRVLLDRWARWMHAPQVGQAVALSSPQASDFLAVKRLIAGGPGQLEFRDGDVWLDGTIQRKTLDQLRQVGILVHDDRHRPRRTPALPDRWRGECATSLWRSAAWGYEHAPPSNAVDDSQIDWLEYVPWTCYRRPFPPVPRTAPAAVLDHYGYNQDLSRGALHLVRDLLLRCQVTVRGHGRLLLRLDDGADGFQLELSHPDLSARLWHNGRQVWQWRRLYFRQPWLLEFAVCDQRVLASLNGSTLVEHEYSPSAAARCASREAPAAIGAAGLHVRLDAPQIYRDLYYMGPSGEQHWRFPQPLDTGEWFVVGDNVPVSIDSRRYGAIDGRTILGPVVPFPRGTLGQSGLTNATGQP